MSKKTIAIFIYANPDHYPPTINAIHLLSQYFNIVVIGRNQDSPSWVYPNNVKVYRLGKFSSVREREQNSAWDKLREYIKFIQQASLLLKDISLIYAYDTFGFTAAYLSQLMKNKTLPIIYHNHDLNQQLFPLSSLTGWVQRYEQKCLNKAKIIIFPSQERSLLFQKITGFNGQLMIIPNFPRKEFWKNRKDFIDLISRRFQSPQILLQGAISVKNSLQELIESLAFLDASIELKLIGNTWSDEEELMMNYSLMKIFAGRIKYFKPVPYSELSCHTWLATIGVCLYKKVDINHITMGTASNKIYEYAACGLPVVISDQPDYREHLAQESWVRFADPDDPQSIALAIQDILKNFETYQSLCLDARQAFEQKYNYELVFSSLLPKIEQFIS